MSVGYHEGVNARIAQAQIRHVERQYGPIAFGLVALLLLWGFIVQPELKSARDTAGSTAVTFREAAVLLEKTSERLERIELRWENAR